MKHDDRKSGPNSHETEPSNVLPGKSQDQQESPDNPPRPQWSLRSMGIDGYKAKVQEHLEKRGFTGDPPSQKRFIDAWNGQTCAKKLAASHIRRSGRKR